MLYVTVQLSITWLYTVVIYFALNEKNILWFFFFSLSHLSFWRGVILALLLRSWPMICCVDCMRETVWPPIRSLVWCTIRGVNPNLPCLLKRCRPSWVRLNTLSSIAYTLLKLELLQHIWCCRLNSDKEHVLPILNRMYQKITKYKPLFLQFKNVALVLLYYKEWYSYLVGTWARALFCMAPNIFKWVPNYATCLLGHGLIHIISYRNRPVFLSWENWCWD